MPLPPSFAKAGFGGVVTTRKQVILRNGRKLKPVMIGTEGEQNTGKTEFLFSVPGPGIILCYDRNFEAALDNPNPPPARRPVHDNYALKAVTAPMNGTLADMKGYTDYFIACRKEFYTALDIPEAVSVMADGDSDFFELQVLATFGKTQGIFPQTRWGDVYAPKRAMIARAWGSGKIIVSTNKLTDEYVEIIGANGLPEIDQQTGLPKKVKTGNLKRQGFKDNKYLYNIQIRHLHRDGGVKVIEKGPLKGKEVKVPGQFGLVILECKVNTELKGAELWGDKCNFRGLMELVYPNVDPRDFGLD